MNASRNASRVSSETTRHERIDILKEFFLENLVEDPIDGTSFDCDVLDTLEAIKERHTNE